MHYTKEEIIGALNNVRRYVCCYASDNYCDCKFGADEGHWKNPHEEKVKGFNISWEKEYLGKEK